MTLDKKAYEITKDMHDAGMTYAKIGKKLTEIGYRSPTGKDISGQEISKFMCNNGYITHDRRSVKEANFDRNKITEIISSMLQTHSNKQIARKLNVYKYSTARGKKWNAKRVGDFIRSNTVESTNTKTVLKSTKEDTNNTKLALELLSSSLPKETKLWLLEKVL